MPDKPVTVAAYAAGASLAAITAFYVFAPTFFLDASSSPSSDRKKGIVGLRNPANDCFINSVLQALAGLGDLRVYLIKELYRRELDGAEVYKSVPEKGELLNGNKVETVMELQEACVTAALKSMLDSLNERPIVRRTITAQPFIQSLERAFHTHIRRTQQDAQEFLQVVVERLCDEYHASANARRRATKNLPTGSILPSYLLDEKKSKDFEHRSIASVAGDTATHIEDVDAAAGFPLEGTMESQIECQQCGYQYHPNPTNFVNLTLQVPQKHSASLNSCFDGLLKTEYIEDFKCDKCRLQYAIEIRTKALETGTTTDEEKEKIRYELDLLKEAIEQDPEEPPEGVELPADAPKCKIGRHMRITVFPQVLAIHLSRSIFDLHASTKNAAKVDFPERLCLGGILDQKWYKLLGIVCHKGSHNSGHYESFRRNFVYAPFSTPDTFSSYAAQSRSSSANTSAVPSPKISALKTSDHVVGSPSPLGKSPSLVPSSPSLSPAETSSPSSSSLSGGGAAATAPTSQPSSDARNSMHSTRSRTQRLADAITSSSTSTRFETGGSSSLSERPSRTDSLFRRRKRYNDRWWRISDEKIKECKTRDVLDMQKEVYLLFYELERPEDQEQRGESGSGSGKRRRK